MKGAGPTVLASSSARSRAARRRCGRRGDCVYCVACCERQGLNGCVLHRGGAHAAVPAGGCKWRGAGRREGRKACEAPRGSQRRPARPRAQAARHIPRQRRRASVRAHPAVAERALQEGGVAAERRALEALACLALRGARGVRLEHLDLHLRLRRICGKEVGGVAGSGGLCTLERGAASASRAWDARRDQPPRGGQAHANSGACTMAGLRCLRPAGPSHPQTQQPPHLVALEAALGGREALCRASEAPPQPSGVGGVHGLDALQAHLQGTVERREAPGLRERVGRMVRPHGGAQT